MAPLVPALLASLLACSPDKPDDSSPGSGDTGDACPMLDCRDTLTLTVLGVNGAPSDWFTFNVTATVSTETSSGSCGSEPHSQEGATCYGDGRVDVYLYGESVELFVAEGDDAPYWFGTLTPTWTAPYDSDECGHYCYLAEETVQLLPCEGCG